MKHSRRGFSLIEMLTVIGIIMLLMAMAAIGFQHLSHSAAGKSTEVMLENCKGLVGEYLAAGGDSTAIQDQQAQYAGTPVPPVPTPYGDVWTPPTGPYVLATVDYSATGSPNSGDVNADSSNRLNTYVQKTSQVFGVLSHTPKARDMLQNMPSKQLLSVGTSQVILDGWKNPIVYVPTGGMLVQLNINGTPTVKTIKAVDGQGFWASAGQDGDFTLGDDNIYSTSVAAH